MGQSKLEPILIIPDAHRPYHDQRAWGVVLQAAKALKPKHLIVMGDFADMYTVSSHSKDPRRANRLPEELANVMEGLDDLDALGAKHKIFLAGNHCDRLQRYLQDKAPELFGVVSIPKLFGLKERGWSYVPYKHDTTLGAAWLTHDVGTAGRNAVFKALDTYQHTIITAHTHRMQYIVEADATGEPKLSAMFGWLGDVERIDYMHKTTARKNWALGFGHGYFDTKTKYVYLIPVPLVNYTCVVNGKVYRG